MSPGEEYYFKQNNVLWHWDDSTLIATQLVRGVYRVFEIDARMEHWSARNHRLDWQGCLGARS